ncbi:S9 family peptidase [Maricaulis virginensis]|uniref:Acyl-peptide hydrolase n=1 Tax=Maricaulis virginensis TaxID=144022 RepID=A0A9W6MN90_9PROT|nr:S9 family peptidase [Maricaulis virginensis]GLK51671.1 acyl-peptide hydrolase [Maricaulis virginensis]
MIKTTSCVLALMAITLPASAQAIRPLSQEDVFRLEAAADPQIAPDGGMVAYVRRSNDIATDRTRSEIWIVGADGSGHRQLLPGEGETGSPRWSPDGAQLAYVRTHDETTTLEVLTLADGASRTLTTLPAGQSGLAWSPDGTQLAWAAFRPAAGPAAADLPERTEDMDWAAGAQVEERLSFRFDGAGELPMGRQQLFVIDLAGGEPRQLTDDEAGAGGDFAWSADGRALYFSADRRPDNGALAPDSELHRIDLATGEIETLTGRTGPDTTPRPSPDGTQLAWLGYDDHRMGYHNVELYVAGPDGTGPRSVTAELDRSVSAPQWSADGRMIYFLYDDSGQTRLARTNLEGHIEIGLDDLTPPTFGRPYTGGSFSVSMNGHVAATVGSSIRPPDVILMSPLGDTRVLTSLNEDVLAEIDLAPAEEIHWASPHDGLDIEGWVLYPPGFDPAREWPMILEIHGGPFSAYGPTFSAELRLMAAAGYVVVYTNPRGSTSYGYDFANLIHHDYPGHDYDDLMGAVDHMIGRGFIDEDRLFVTGGSGGGVLTAWIIGNTDRFAAAAVVKPVINWTSFVLYSDLPQFFYRYWFASAPWEDPEEYWRRSPLSLVGNVETPTLMMVGGADLRTPRAETEQYYSALHLNGVPTRLVVIPDSYHGISNSRPSRLLTKVAEILRWFEEYDPAAQAGGSEPEAAND